MGSLLYLAQNFAEMKFRKLNSKISRKFRSRIETPKISRKFRVMGYDNTSNKILYLLISISKISRKFWFPKFPGNFRNGFQKFPGNLESRAMSLPPLGKRPASSYMAVFR